MSTNQPHAPDGREKEGKHMQDGMTSWAALDRELNEQAREAGIHSAREAEFHDALDAIAALHPEWGIPTEAEALEMET
jgi:antitoxin component HigA of HigAB toxin-antitoxin module